MKVKILSTTQSANKSWFVELLTFPWFGLFGSKQVTYCSDGPIAIFWYRMPDLTEITVIDPNMSLFLDRVVRRHQMANE